MFQFPTSGKARVNTTKDLNDINSIPYVSIPYEREGTCKHPHKKRCHAIPHQFQFPTSGKARVNGNAEVKDWAKRNQFQFPTSGKARVNDGLVC